MKILSAILAAVCAALLPGCLSATKSVVTEYDAAGRVVCVTESAESVVSSLTRSTAGKTVVAWESGWAACISASAATLTDPTPTVRLFAGKTDKGFVSGLPGQQDWAGIAGAVAATKYELAVTPDGIRSAGSK